MSSILEPLVQRLRALPSSQLEAIAREAGVAKTLPRKLASRDRTNPGVRTIQPLVDYFEAVDRGERALPAPDRPAPGLAGRGAVVAQQAAG
jgi:hypothetical protein